MEAACLVKESIDAHCSVRFQPCLNASLMLSRTTIDNLWVSCLFGLTFFVFQGWLGLVHCWRYIVFTPMRAQ